MAESTARRTLTPTLMLAEQIAALALESGLTDGERIAALRIAAELIEIPEVRESSPAGS
jgi:hypothetical protein